MKQNGKVLISDKDNQTNEQVIDGGEITGIGHSEYKVDPIKKQKADTARTLAIILVVILAASVAMHYGFTAWLLVHGKPVVVENMNDIFTTWLPVISGLTGSAVTFFFTKEK